MPHSRLKGEIARILKREGFIREYAVEGHGGKKILRLYLKYTGEGEPVIQGLQRMSRPSLRRYASAKRIPKILRGLGVVIMSTSQGILTGREAARRGVGGEVICYVW